MKLHQNKDIFEFLCYSGNKIRKTQNEHQTIVCQNFDRTVVVKFKVFIFIFWCLYRLVFDLETIGVS